jgi:hypothetical protein
MKEVLADDYFFVFSDGKDLNFEGLNSMAHTLSQICILLRSSWRDCESEDEFIVM